MFEIDRNRKNNLVFYGVRGNADNGDLEDQAGGQFNRNNVRVLEMISYYTGRLRVEDQARDEHAPEGDAGDPTDEGGAAVERPLAARGQARPRLLPALQGQGGGPQEVQHAPQGRAVMHGGLLLV